MNMRYANPLFKNEKRAVLVIVLISSISVIGLGYLIHSNPKTISKAYEIFNQPVSNIEIYNNIQTGDITINMLNTSLNNILKADWTYTTTSGYGPAKDVITYHKLGDILKIFIDFEFDEKITDLKFNIYINPNYEKYSFFSQNAIGNLKAKFESMIFNHFYVGTSTGDIDLTMDYIGFFNNLTIESNSGRIIMNCWEMTFHGNGSFNVISDSSYIDVDWAQHVKLNHNVDITFISNNYAELEYWCPFEVNRYDVTLESNGGTRRFSGDAINFIEIESDHYQSVDINDTRIDLLTINFKSNEGYLWVYIKNCFKPQRYCDKSMSQSPWDVETNGTYPISRSSYEISNIQVIDNIENANITYFILPLDSEYLFNAEWNLIYEQGPNRGLGFIDIKISKKVVGDVLEIYIDLIYEKDRIRPIFTGGYFRIYSYPGSLI
jgi:hypothetical protein